MDDSIIKTVLSKYGVRPKKCKLIKQSTGRSVWKIKGEEGKYALKSVSAERAHIISNVSRYLSDKDVPVITVLPALNGDFVVKINEFFFIIFPWFEGEPIEYDVPENIKRMSSLLAQFHKASRGYVTTGKPIKEKRPLLKEYTRSFEQMTKIYKELTVKEDKIIKIFSSHYSWLSKRCKWVIESIQETSYHDLMSTAKINPLLGHRDYARHNILKDKRGNWIILDLDDVGIVLPIRDLSGMIISIDNELGNWSSDRIQSILQAYRNVRPFSKEEENLLLKDLCFPHQAISLIAAYYNKGDRKGIRLKGLENCLAQDKEKIRSLSITELEWNA